MISINELRRITKEMKQICLFTTQKDLTDYHEALCGISFLVGRLEGLIDKDDELKKGVDNGNTIHGSGDTKTTSKTKSVS